MTAKIVRIRPTLTTGAYSSGDQMGDSLEIAGAVEYSGGVSKLISIFVVDNAGQKQALDILFFSSAPALTSSDNAALSITDAEMTAKFIGRVSIATGDYTDTAANSDATKRMVDLVVGAAAGQTSIYAVLCSKGSPTYAVDSLTIGLGFVNLDKFS